jgi:signal transduction histidine kinase
LPVTSAQRNTTLSFLLAALVLIGIGAFSLWSASQFAEAAQLRRESFEIQAELIGVLSGLADAETSQRGYLLTNKEEYLLPFENGKTEVETRLARLKQEAGSNPRRLGEVAHLDSLAHRKLAELERTIALARSGLRDSAMSIVLTDVGRQTMVHARATVSTMTGEEQANIHQLQSRMDQGGGLSQVAIIAGILVALVAVVFSGVIVSRDIAARAKAENALASHVGELEALNKELETFSYSVSHDLRAPLRAIDGFSRILAEDYRPVLDGEANRLLDVISDNARRMGNLIDDLLTFSRFSRREPEMQRIDMVALVKSVIVDFEKDPAMRNGIEIKVGSLSPAQGDSSLIRQVWINLISNALKYSRNREHPEITVESRTDDESVVYSVRDNGVGFDMTYANKLFAVFQRLHSSTEFEGTGVGLAIVQRIVHRHGGRTWAEAIPDQGATFSFSLPKATDSI